MESTLHARYPGVRILGPYSPDTHIDGNVTIAPGATIHLSTGFQLRNGTVVDKHAVILGGCMESCIVEGLVAGGRIRNTHVGVFAQIAGGTLDDCFVNGHAEVHNGTLRQSTVTDLAVVAGGEAAECLIGGNAHVLGGRLIRCIVQGNARVTGGEAMEHWIDGEAAMDGNPKARPSVRLTLASNRPGLVICSRRTGPPLGVTDPWNGRVLVDAMCTWKGETYSRSSLDPTSQRRSYPNRIIKDRSRRWEEYAVALSLLQMANVTQLASFEEPPLYDPFTCKPIESAVLCSCGETYDRADLQRWLPQIAKCPVKGHPLVEEALYPNLAVQRLIDDRRRGMHELLLLHKRRVLTESAFPRKQPNRDRDASIRGTANGVQKSQGVGRGWQKSVAGGKGKVYR